MRYLSLLCGMSVLVISFWPSLLNAQSGSHAFWLTIDSAIGPASHDYLKRGFSKALEQNAQLIIIQVDTPVV